MPHEIATGPTSADGGKVELPKSGGTCRAPIGISGARRHTARAPPSGSSPRQSTGAWPTTPIALRVIHDALIGATGSGSAGLARTLAAHASLQSGPGRNCGCLCDRAIVGHCQLAVAAIVHCPGLPDDGLAIATAGPGRGRLCEGARGEQETSCRDYYSMHCHVFPPFSGHLQLARSERPTHRPPLQPAPRCPSYCVYR